MSLVKAAGKAVARIELEREAANLRVKVAELDARVERAKNELRITREEHYNAAKKLAELISPVKVGDIIRERNNSASYAVITGILPDGYNIALLKKDGTRSLRTRRFFGSQWELFPVPHDDLPWVK